MKALRITLISAVSLLVLGYGAVVYSYNTQKPVEHAKTTKQPVKTPPTAEELLKLVNAERKRVGAPELKLQDDIMHSAQYKADDMASRNYFSHFDPTTKRKNGLDYLNKTYKECSYVSENIQMTEDGTSQDALDWWLHSKPHYKAMINPEYTTTGFGISQPPKVLDYEKPTISVEHFCREA